MKLPLGIITSIALFGCATTSQPPEKQFEDVSVKGSYLQQDDLQTGQNNDIASKDSETVEGAKYSRVRPFSTGFQAGNPESLEEDFPTTDSISVAVDNMPVGDFLHYALGDQLKLNYVLASDLPLSDDPITMNIRESISSRRFFTLVQDILQQRSMSITANDNIYYVVKADASARGSVAVGVGKRIRDIPNAATQILQIIPTNYGISTTMERTVAQMVDATVTPDFQQNVLFVQGRRSEVIRAVRLVQLLDKPLNRGKDVGIIELTFISAEDFIAQVRQLLINEGVSVGVGAGTGENIVFVPLTQIGAVALFSNDRPLINRVQFWGEELDKPATNSESQYFMYSPKFARASDLGDSLAPLLGQQGNRQSTSASSTSNSATGQRATTSATRTSSNNVVNQLVNNLSLVVDERSNSLIFYGAGSEYQSILPLVKQLDVLPKQIVLDVSVVEVRLTGQFQQGVEFAIREMSGDSVRQSASTLGALGLDEFGGLSYVFDSIDLDVTAKLFRNNSLANILSNPTLVVRDGVTASMSVGNDIPVISSVTAGSDIDTRNTTQFSYRRTGLQLDVKPTVNAQNIVLMEITQFLSDTDTTFSSQNPAFFERTLQTEVVAKSGQTILLGGIISENNSQGDQSVPGLADIPLLGNLFKGKSNTADKTELVVLVTARVLDNTEEWEQIMRQFEGGLQSIKLDN